MSDETTTTRVGDYEILGVLGAGGMGKVYKVRNVITDRVEAMKVLLPDLAGRRELADRFLREIKTLAGLSHPNIAALRTALTWNNQLVMVMEYVDGISLAARLKQGPLSPAEAVNYIGQVLAALSYAHSLHIVHRDIKPANMMLTPEGVVKLMDFGIARSQTDPTLTATGSTLGSLHYMSPEQIRGEPADARSDLYSVGVSLYEMTTGQRPFQAENDYGLMAAHLQEFPQPPGNLRPDLPPGLSDVILMAMDKDPARRFQTADAMRAALQSVPLDSSVSAPVGTATSVGSPVATRTSVATPSALANAAKSGSGEVWAGPSPAPPHTPLPVPVNAAAAPPATIAPPPPSSLNAAPPAAPPMPQPAAVATSAHRGLYVALGGLLVVLILAAAGIYVPRWRKAHAGEAARVSQPASLPSAGASDARPANTSTPPTTQPALSPTPPPATPVQSRAEVAPPPNTTAAEPRAPALRTVPARKPPAEKQAAQLPAGSQSAGEERAAASSQTTAASRSHPPAVDPARLQQLEHDLDLLGSRAAAVNSGLDSLRQSQAAQGLGLRGDIVSAQQRMQTYLDKAQAALKNQDADAAKQYLDRADSEVALLEKFLGH